MGGAATNKIGDTVTGEKVAAVRGEIDAADEPFFVADFDAGAGAS